MPTLRMVPPYHLPVVELTISGKQHFFIIDTGAQMSVFKAGLFLTTKEIIEAEPIEHEGIGGVGNGTYHPRKTFRFIGVTTEGMHFTTSLGTLFRGTISGLIGQDILQKFKTVTFDNANHTVRFEL